MSKQNGGKTMIWIKRIVLLMLLSPAVIAIRVVLKANDWFDFVWGIILGMAIFLFVGEEKQ